MGINSYKTRYRIYNKLHPVKVGSVKWTKGFWADRFELCRNATIPSIYDAMNDPKNSAVFTNFYIAAGLKSGTHIGTDWGDGDCYKWIEAVANTYSVTKEKELDQMMDKEIQVISKAQAPDGYIGTQIQLSHKGRWRLRRHHELYNMGHLMTAACVHYNATGKDSFLNVAKKLGDYLYGVFQPRPPELAHFGWNPSNIMGLVDLYRATENKKYLELAGIFVDMRGSASQDFGKVPGYVLTDGGDQNQDRVPLRKETEAVGHGVTAMYLYCGAADVYSETGEKPLLDALERIWNDVVFRKMYITGGIGALHWGTSKRHDMVHEAFGREYQLPNSTAYNETCANIGNAMWNWRLLNITGEVKYADVMERVLYNSMLSTISIDGKQFCYTNPLRWRGDKHVLLSNDSYSRWRIFGCYCCPPQVARTIAGLHNWAYSISDEGVWINLYGGSILETKLPDGTPIKLIQDTDYPWDGHISFTIYSPDKDFSIFLRIPGWTDDAEIRINNEKLNVKANPGTYIQLFRNWRNNDTIELMLPLKIRLMLANQMVEETRNQLSIMRGPIVYCLEGVDLPEGIGMNEVSIPRDIQLKPMYDKNFLGGITFLDGVAYRVQTKNDHGLYNEMKGFDVKAIPVKLIPYYAWNNRGVTDMTVWMPIC